MTTDTKQLRELANVLEGNDTKCICAAGSYYECGCKDATWPEAHTRTAALRLREAADTIDAQRALLERVDDYFNKPMGIGPEWMTNPVKCRQMMDEIDAKTDVLRKDVAEHLRGTP